MVLDNVIPSQTVLLTLLGIGIFGCAVVAAVVALRSIANSTNAIATVIAIVFITAILMMLDVFAIVDSNTRNSNHQHVGLAAGGGYPLACKCDWTHHKDGTVTFKCDPPNCK